jgi:Ethanolamine utilization protein EutJ (predicted chaperonin)
MVMMNRSSSNQLKASNQESLKKLWNHKRVDKQGKAEFPIISPIFRKMIQKIFKKTIQKIFKKKIHKYN